jgi:ferritin-like metal-binding protein YciE
VAEGFLLEILALERRGVKFYKEALDDLEHDELGDQLEEFLDETKHHVEYAEEV